MLCAPMILLAEVATSGALSAAVGGVLGSEILGGAVLGLIASDGDPMGAVLGGLGAGIFGKSGLLASKAAESAGGDIASQLASSTVGNEGVSSVAADVAAGGGTLSGESGLADALRDATSGGTVAAGATEPVSSLVTSASEGPIGSALAGDYTDLGAGISRGTASDVLAPSGGSAGVTKTLTDGASSGGTGADFFSKAQDWIKKNPELAKEGFGVVKGIGTALAQQDQLKSRYQLQKELEEERRRRAYGGIGSWSMPFRPNPNYTPPQPAGAGGYFNNALGNI